MDVRPDSRSLTLDRFSGMPDIAGASSDFGGGWTGRLFESGWCLALLVSGHFRSSFQRHSYKPSDEREGPDAPRVSHVGGVRALPVRCGGRVSVGTGS